MSGTPIILAQGGAAPARPIDAGTARNALSLLGLISALLVVLIVVLVLVMRSYRRNLVGRKKPKKAFRPDPWKESARRLKVPGEDGEAGPDDGTVDIDPDDLPRGNA